jgi:hypothetical protein
MNSFSPGSSSDFKFTDAIEQGSRVFYLQIERDREGNHISIWSLGAFRGGQSRLRPVSR